VLKMPVCFKLLCQKQSETSHLSRHSCKFNIGQSCIDKHLHPSSFRVPQKVKDEVTDASISLRCRDFRHFGTVTGSRFLDYSQSVIKIGALHENLDVKHLLLPSTKIYRSTQKEGDKRRKLFIPQHSAINAVHLRTCGQTTTNTYPT
jgi:hypothetical protein